MRHADAGYEIAIECAKENGLNLMIAGSGVRMVGQRVFDVAGVDLRTPTPIQAARPGETSCASKSIAVPSWISVCNGLYPAQ